MSLRARLLAAFAYTLLVVLIALEVPLGRNLGKRVNAEIEAEAAGQAQIVAASASERLDRPVELGRLARRSARELDGRVVIVGAAGRLLADSSGAAPPGALYDTPQRPEIGQALDGQLAQGQRRSDTLDEDLLFTAVPVLEAGRTAGAVRVTQSVGAVDAAIRNDVLALAGVGLLALALGLGVAWILAGSISRPIRALAGVARRMAGGELDARAQPHGSREQVELARAFNEMADRLSGLVASQRAFVADASHQLRTPLTGLRLRIEAASDRARDPGVAAELEAAERETGRLSELVDDLLTLASSEQPAEAGPTELGQAVEDAERRWRAPSRERGRELTVAGEGPATVRTSERDVAIVLDNLIENAIKYSPEGSPVSVRWRADDGVGAIQVHSRGGPLSGEDLQHAFERFYRGARAGRGPGTGLGLAIVAALARRAGGRARLANDVDGVVASVELPLASDDFADS